MAFGGGTVMDSAVDDKSEAGQAVTLRNRYHIRSRVISYPYYALAMRDGYRHFDKPYADLHVTMTFSQGLIFLVDCRTWPFARPASDPGDAWASKPVHTRIQPACPQRISRIWVTLSADLFLAFIILLVQIIARGRTHIRL